MSQTELQQQISEHRYEIDTLKDTVSKVLTSIDNNTAAQQAMTTQFAVYVAKHDATEEKLRSLHTKSDRQAEDIAAMRPVVDGVRGLMWKVVFASLSGGGLVATIAAVTISNGS